MKQQRFRYRMLAFLTIGLLVAAGVYGVYSVSTYESRWFANARNTRYQTAKKTVVPGDIIDRNGVVLATSDTDGNRVYQSNVKSRSSIVHLLGDNEGSVANGVESFQANYLLGFETSLSERVLALIKGETRRGDDLTLTVDSKLCTAIVQAFVDQKSSHGIRR